MFNSWWIHPQRSRQATYARSTVTRGDQVTSLIINNWKITDGKTENHIPLVVPGVQATDLHQSEALGDRKQERAVGDHSRNWIVNSLREWPHPFAEDCEKRRQAQQTFLKLLRNKFHHQR